jgi:preprotein translocase subunit SecD
MKKAFILGLALYSMSVAYASCPEKSVFEIRSEKGTSLFCALDVDCIKVQSESKTQSVTFKLNEKGQTKLSEYTRIHTGAKLSEYVCGKLIDAPVVKAKIESGLINVSGLAIEQITCTKKKLKVCKK